MVIVDIMLCLFILFIMKIAEESKSAKRGKEFMRTLCPTGWSIEYEACRRAREEVQEYVSKYGREKAEEHYAKYSGKYVKDPLINYVRVKGRLAAIEQNRSPICYTGFSPYNLNSAYDSIDIFSFGNAINVVSMHGGYDDYNPVTYRHYVEKDEASLRYVENILAKRGMTIKDLPDRFTNFHTTKHDY